MVDALLLRHHTIQLSSKLKFSHISCGSERTSGKCFTDTRNHERPNDAQFIILLLKKNKKNLPFGPLFIELNASGFIFIIKNNIFVFHFAAHFLLFLLQLLLQFCLGLSWKRDFNFNVTFSSINKG